MNSTKVTDPELLKQLNSLKESTGSKENLLQKVVRYGIKDPAIGVLNMGREFANLPHKLSRGHIPEFSPSDFDFGKTLGVENPETSDKLIQLAGQIAPSFALPGANLGKVGKLLESIPKVGKFASHAVSQAVPQGLFSASQAPQDMLKAGGESAATMAPFSVLNQLMQTTNPTVKMAARAGAALGSAYLGREAAKTAGAGETFSDLAGIVAGALGGRGFKSKEDIRKKLTEGVSPDVAEERLKAAERLGLTYLTPAEAGVSPWAAKQQGSLGKTEEGGKMLYERGRERQGSEKEAIERTMNKIYSEETMGAQKKEAYEKMKPIELPEEFVNDYKDNEVIKHAQKMVESKPAYKEALKEYMPDDKAQPKEGLDKLKDMLKGVEGAETTIADKKLPKTSLIYWDHVKRALDDMVSAAEGSGNNNEARIIKNIRNQMRDKMDEAYPEYAKARGLAEREIVRKNLEKAFDQKEMNGTNFYRMLASEKKFDQLMMHLREAPEAQQALKDMRLLFKDLMGPPTIKTAKGTEERGMNQARSSGAFLESLLENVFTGGKNDKAAIEFITSKDWHKQLEEINKISDKQTKMAALALTLSKGVSQYAGSQERKPLEIDMVGGHR